MNVCLGLSGGGGGGAAGGLFTVVNNLNFSKENKKYRTFTYSFDVIIVSL